MQELTGDLRIAGRGGLRITPVNIFAVVALVDQKKAALFSDGWGYLCVRQIQKDVA